MFERKLDQRTTELEDDELEDEVVDLESLKSLSGGKVAAVVQTKSRRKTFDGKTPTTRRY